MKGLLIPLVMALAGAGAGGGAAYVLRPGAPEADERAEDGHDGAAAQDAHGEDDHGDGGHGGEAAAEKGHGGEADHAEKGHAKKGGHDGGHGGGHGAQDDASYVKLDNQFVVPVIEDGRTEALVMMLIGLDVAPGASESVYSKEPKLRDALLRVMFDHANAGGFAGGFTGGDRVEPLRDALRERARAILGAELIDVLILDLVRQEV